MTFRKYTPLAIEDHSGLKKELQCNEGNYGPAEITCLLKALRIKTIDIYGATRCFQPL